MTMMKSKYQCAEQLLPWNLAPKLKNVSIEPHWLDDHRFWFKRDLKDGYEFILVDSQGVTQAHTFNHERLAVSLTELLNQTVNSKQLPIKTFELQTENRFRLVIDHCATQGRGVLLELESYSCTFETGISQTTIEDDMLSVTSPNGEHEVLSRNHNLFLRECTTGIEKALTENGEAHYGYGNRADFLSIGNYEGKPSPPAVMWSPDGRYLAIQRIDERQVRDMPIMQSVGGNGNLRPDCQNVKMAFPGDEHLALTSLCVIDLESSKLINCDRPPVTASNSGPIEVNAVYWAGNNCIYYVEWTRDRQTHRLVGFDYVKGTSFVVVEEKDHGFSGPWSRPMIGSPIISVLSEVNEFIWYSRRSGWGHLYRYDLNSGEFKNAITSGDYVITNIHRVDIENNCLYFSACGREPDRDPYFEHFYRINLDGSDLVLLTPEASQHDIIMPRIDSLSAENRDVFVDTISRVDQPSRSVLRSIDDGAELMALSEFDNTLLSSTPYTPPLPFTAKATDGDTDLWGVMYRPSDFDESKSYPVILLSYGTPQACITPKRFAQISAFSDEQFYIVPPIAELGFIVIILDPRGTPLRSKAFHDAAYGNLQNGGGIDDQVAAVKQLGKRYSWIDLERVGITGYSGGGFTSARAMLSHPDFFKVAVSNAGNHDQRIYCAGWAEPFQGLLDDDNYNEQACVHLAQNLKGKLLLTHGDRDANVHIAHTLQLVDKLIEHNKDFDLLILPNRQHTYYLEPYFIRRLWDYFVEHLLGETPPKNYCIVPPRK